MQKLQYVKMGGEASSFHKHDKNEKPVYIVMFGFANIVCGGPIYMRNKIKYMEEHGWNVIVFPTNSGKVYIHGLEKYEGECYSFINEFPGTFTKKQRRKLLGELKKKIPLTSTVIIETGTDYTAYWGELLAENIGARHFVFWEDEKNPNVDWAMDFYCFKYYRHELACISERAMRYLFRNNQDILDRPMYSVSFYCANVVEDFTSELMDKIPTADFIIGSIGRLEKAFVPEIIDGVIKFAKKHSEYKVAFVLFGGSDEATVTKIKKQLENISNLSYFITGYLFPIPLKALKMCDVFVSGAGSALVTAYEGFTTVEIDMYTNKPVGICVINECENVEYVACSRGNLLEDYLEQLLINRDIPVGYTIERDTWNAACKRFDKHIEFINSSNKNREYYPICNLPMNLKKRIKLFLRGFLGMNLFELLRKIKKSWINMARRG